MFTDNTTDMWYCNKQGGVGSWPLCQEALRLWNWLQHQNIFLVAQQLAGSLNVRAGELSCVALRIMNGVYIQRWCKVSSANGENLGSIY